MTYRLFWRSGASRDVREALDWYDSEAPHQVPRFLRHIRDAEQRIIDRPFLQRMFAGGYRCCVLTTFPYELWYRVDEGRETIQILAFKHARRDISRFLERLV